MQPLDLEVVLTILVTIFGGFFAYILNQLNRRLSTLEKNTMWSGTFAEFKESVKGQLSHIEEDVDRMEAKLDNVLLNKKFNSN
jgi:hypothetical protein